MSDNPFASVPEKPLHPANVSVPPKPPGVLTLILVVCLILGILGLTGTCFAGIGLAFQSTFEKMAIDGAISDGQREIQKISFESSRKVMVFGIALSGLNLIIGSMLIFGSIGGLNRKESGRKILGFGILAAIFYSFLKMAFYIYNQVVASAGMQEGIEAAKDEPFFDEMQQFSSFTTAIGWGAAGFFVFMSLILLGFYIWAKVYLNKDPVVKYFASQNR